MTQIGKRCQALCIRALIAALLLPAAAAAYQLNPLKDRNRGGEAPKFGRSMDSVHEDITHSAIACADRLRGPVPIVPRPICSMAVSQRSALNPGNLANPLIVGLWWNDDPRQFVYANEMVSAALQWADAQDSARRVRATGGRHWDPKMTRLIYRSHFGDLQFLHAMASRDHESAHETQHRILGWLGFTYRVATGEIGADTRLRHSDEPVRSAFAGYRSWTVKKLFKPRAAMKPLPLRELALGSLLHSVQDSYAAGHTVRDMAPSLRCPRGRVTKFLSFLNQDQDRHRAWDSRGALHSYEPRFTAIQNPVEASARLIAMARRGADWSTVVEPYVRGTLLCIDDDAELSGPGDFAIAAGPSQRP